MDLGPHKFVVNFKYTVKEGQSAVEELKTDSYAKFDSVCSGTMVGFNFQDKSKKFSCFYGLKNGHD